MRFIGLATLFAATVLLFTFILWTAKAVLLGVYFDWTSVCTAFVLSCAGWGMFAILREL